MSRITYGALILLAICLALPTIAQLAQEAVPALICVLVVIAILRLLLPGGGPH
jgi:hypothetical protein